MERGGGGRGLTSRQVSVDTEVIIEQRCVLENSQIISTLEADIHEPLCFEQIFSLKLNNNIKIINKFLI